MFAMASEPTGLRWHVVDDRMPKLVPPPSPADRMDSRFRLSVIWEFPKIRGTLF